MAPRPLSNSSAQTGPFELASDWRRFALGYGALWFTLLLLVEAGGEDLAVALAVLIASGATILSIEAVLRNLRLEGANGST